MRIAKLIATLVAIVAGLFLFFRYAGEFPAHEAAALAVGGWVAWEVLAWREEKSREAARYVDEHFEPFCILVLPKWWELLRDCQLVQTEEEYKAIWERVRARPSGAYHVMPDGIRFTFLKPGLFGQGLVYWDSRKRFTTEVDFEERIPELEINVAAEGGRPLNFTPDIHVKNGPNGLNFWVTTRESFSSYLAYGAPDPSASLVKIAALPITEAGLFWLPGDYDPARLKNERAKRDKLLAEAGWVRKDRSDPEESWDEPYAVEHKYFRVEYWAI